MATLPSARTRVSETAGARAGGVDLICVITPCATNADVTPRIYGNAEDMYTQHGYCEGVEYAALHVEKTRRSVLAVGIPIVTVGAVGRKNTSGNTGSSVVDAVAGGTGVLAEHDGRAKVVRGGTVGTDQIVLDLSCDGGRTYKRVRLGTANSYAIPFFNVTLTFAAGTLVAGDTIITWHGSAPRGDSAGWQAAREALAAQLKLFRSMLLIGDVQNSTEANAFNTQLEAYETSNERFVYGRVSVLDRLPYATMSRVTARMTGNPSLTFAEVGATGDTITRGTGSWISDGFVVGDWITVTGSASNNVSGKIASLSATVITLDTTDLVAEGPVSNVTVVATPRLIFAEVGATGDTITRSRGSWLDDGFRIGDSITVSGTASNNFSAALVTGVTATVLTLDTQDLTAEELGSSAVTIAAGQTPAVWMAAIDSAFAAVDAKRRIDLSAGRGRVISPFSGWNMRRPAGWFASLREYTHDLHIATWRKEDGPVDADLYGADGVLSEWDDRAYGGAGLAARFTCLRTWANGPAGAFVAMSLTRGSEASVLSQTHNVAVTNLACQTVQLSSEDAAVGQSITLNADGTATAESLATIAQRINRDLKLALLTNQRNEGPRASNAVWTPSTDDLFNVPEPVLTGVLALDLNGTIHTVDTVVRVSGG